MICHVCGRLNNRSYGVFTLACNISPIVIDIAFVCFFVHYPYSGSHFTNSEKVAVSI